MNRLGTILSRSFFHVALPVGLTVVLFAGMLFVLVLPALERTIMHQEEKMVRELTRNVVSLLGEYEQRVANGELEMAEAQRRARERIGSMRYGPERKDYFWVVNLDGQLVVHPWRPDLIETNVLDYVDEEGNRLFAEAVEIAREKGQGYLGYLWQWKDEAETVEPKTSHVQLFEPWGWVVGTGVYIRDVLAETRALTQQLIQVCAAILVVVILLSAYVIERGIAVERQRTQAQATLRQREAWLTNIVENANEVVYAIDPDGTFVFVPGAWTRLLGHQPEEVLGRHFSEFVHNEDVCRCLEYLEAILENRSTPGRTVEYRIHHKNGQWRWHSSTGARFEDDDGNLRVVGIGQDIGDRLEAQSRQKQLMQADKLVSLGTLVAGVAHEINNPNSYLLMNIDTLSIMWESIVAELDERYVDNPDLMLGGLPYEEARACLPKLMEDMIHGSQRIKRTVEELRDFARERPADAYEQVDLNTVVVSAVALVGSTIRKSTDDFHETYEEGLPLVWGSAHRLEQVIINLLLNACQALPDKSGAIHVTTRRHPDDGGVCVEISDTGVGIDEEGLMHVTDPFYTTKRDRGGTGLGLSVSATIMQEHGGNITFASQVGAGTTVRVCLPALAGREAS